MNETEFTMALHECLDARRDPLDEPTLCRHLAEHPEQLESFAVLRERLAGLSEPAAAVAGAATTLHARRRPALSRLYVIGALALAAAIAIAAVWPTPAGPTPPSRGILAASLEELRPRAGAAVSFTVRQCWPPAAWPSSDRPRSGEPRRPDSIFVTYEMRSEHR